jgi:hypothetical protein
VLEKGLVLHDRANPAVVQKAEPDYDAVLLLRGSRKPNRFDTIRFHCQVVTLGAFSTTSMIALKLFGIGAMLLALFIAWRRSPIKGRQRFVELWRHYRGHFGALPFYRCTYPRM